MDVSIVRCENYTEAVCERALREALAPFGGLDWVRQGMRVVIKANLVSVNVDKLVQEGLLERRPVPGDRRKTELLCTEKAQPIIERGHALQEAFVQSLVAGIDETQMQLFCKTIGQMSRNLEKLLERNS